MTASRLGAVERVLAVLKEHEDTLSDGFRFYCNEDDLVVLARLLAAAAVSA